MNSHHQLNSILNDSEAVQQFYKFLSSSFSCGHLLDFWFACKGFRLIIDGDDQLKLLQVAKAIYRTYVKTDTSLSVPVNDSTKREIRSTLAAFSHSYNNSITGGKRLPVLRTLFDSAQKDIQNLLSRRYLADFLQSDSFKILPNSLNTLELTICQPENPFSQSHVDEKDVIPLSDPSVNGDLRKSSHLKVAISDSTSDKNRRPAVESGGTHLTVTASELIACMNPAEIGTRDDLETAAPRTPLITTIVAPPSDATLRKPGINLAEIDPRAFAQTLSHRLEKVKESRGKMKSLLSRIPGIDPEEKDGEHAELASVHADFNQLPSPRPPTRSTRLPSVARHATSAVSSDLLCRRLTNLLPPVVATETSGPSSDDAQVILEDHCSRIWTDERRVQPLNVCRKGGRRFDVYSISSFDSGLGGVCGGVNSSDSESCVSRRGAFHHQQYRWNNALQPLPPAPPICSFCRRTPSMSLTPGAHRKETGSVEGSYRWGVQYQRVQYHHSHHHHHPLNDGASDIGGRGGDRAVRSKSLTSDSPSVFDSGLSSTYDHLPPPRRSRQDEYKITRHLIEGPTTAHGGGLAPLPGRELIQHFLDDCNPAKNSTLASSSCTANPDFTFSRHLAYRPERHKQLPPSGHPTTTNLNSPLCSDRSAPPLASPTPSSLEKKQTTQPPSDYNLVVGYYLCDEPVPYRTVWTGPVVVHEPTTTTTTTTPTTVAASRTSSVSITLAQFKQLVAKKGVYRYFFKTASDDFGTGCVHEEVGDDNAPLPLWEGKVIARIERIDC